MIVKLSKVRKGKLEKYLIASDWHSFSLHNQTYSIMLKYAKEHKITNLIILGDFIDAPYFMEKSSEFKKWIKRENNIEDFFLPNFEEECEWANSILDELQKQFKNIILMGGNHCCLRVRNFREKYCPSAYSHNFSLSYQLKLESRKIQFIPYGDWLDVGEVSLCHGHFHGSSCHKKHYDASGGRTTIFGHIHHHESKAFLSRGVPKKSYSLPAMCNLNPDYIRGSPTNWTNGFASMVITDKSHFINVYEIMDNSLALPNGKVLFP
jgi:hypothetical protein